MKRVLLTFVAILAVASTVANDNYLPTIVSGREYIYASQKYTLDLSTFPSKGYSGYTSMDRKDFASYITPLKEDGAIVLRSFPSDYTVAAVEKVQELYTTIERNWVYFDYNLQVGDTLCVVDRIDEYSIIGRIIKVISIDTIEIESQPRLRYNLLSTNFNATLLSNGKHYFHYYGDLNNGEHSLYEYANHCYEDSWIEGIGYTKYNYNGYTLELQRLYEEDVLIYGSEKEDSEYLPTIVPLREYFYKNKQGYERYMPTRMSERYPGYVDYSDGCCDVRKECNSQVLKEFYEEAFCIYETAKLMKENFTTTGEDWVYFDYNMQVGDTLCVVDDWTATTGHAQYVGGRIVKVLSIDTIETMGVERTRYNLESKEFTCNYGMYAKDPTKDPTIPGNIVYYMDLWYDDTSFSDSWIEGIGYTTFTPVQVSGFDIELDVYELQCVFEEGELIYCADGADCNGKSDVDNSKIDFTTLTLHRQGHVLMAVFPAAGVGESITLYDTTGRVVASQTLRAGATTASIGVASLPSGVYIVRLSNGIAMKVVL